MESPTGLMVVEAPGLEFTIGARVAVPRAGFVTTTITDSDGAVVVISQRR